MEKIVTAVPATDTLHSQPAQSHLEQSSASRTSPSAHNKSPRRKLTVWPLVAATFFMVSGGTYGTEDIVHGAGYLWAIAILLLTPFLWSLPTAYMIGELASALPEEGGFYAWVRRAMGPMWGFQEAWLSLVASIFDMAIYPTLFVLYLTHLFPYFGIGHRGVIVAGAMVWTCALLNIAGIHVVAKTSKWLFVALSVPFALLVGIALWKHGQFTGASAPSVGHVSFISGLLVAMWNYMGWDNASTIAAEVHEPQKTYSRAIFGAVGVVALSYILPVIAMALTGVAPTAFETGAWADLAGIVAGNWLRVAVVGGGMVSAFGMFNALVMSYSRLPLAMAQDGMLPKFFGKQLDSTRAPWVAIVVCAIFWTLSLGLGFERLVTIDILIYGLSLMLEFAALIALRIKEPGLERPFRVPGGLGFAVALGAVPMFLLGFAAVQSQKEQILGMSSFQFGTLLIATGFIAYYVREWIARTRPSDFALQPSGD